MIYRQDKVLGGGWIREAIQEGMNQPDRPGTDSKARVQEHGLLDEALTHKSHAVEMGGVDNERLEFLGDAVLDC